MIDTKPTEATCARCHRPTPGTEAAEKAADTALIAEHDKAKTHAFCPECDVCPCGLWAFEFRG